MVIMLILGSLIGAVLGLTGAGGGILAVPALVFSMAWSMQQAAPVALIAVSGSAAIGAIDGLRHKLVRYRAAILMAVAGMLITPLGVRTAQMLSQQWLTGLFALVMLFVAARMLRKGKGVSSDAAHVPRLTGIFYPLTGRFEWSWPTGILLAAIGAVTGFMTGLLGVGGGFIVMPLLRKFTNVPMHGIVATSLLVTALVSGASVIGACMHGVAFPAEVVFPFVAATGVGMLAGRRLAHRLSPQHVQISFAVVLVVVACGLLLKSLNFIYFVFETKSARRSQHNFCRERRFSFGGAIPSALFHSSCMLCAWFSQAAILHSLP